MLSIYILIIFYIIEYVKKNVKIKHKKTGYTFHFILLKYWLLLWDKNIKPICLAFNWHINMKYFKFAKKKKKIAFLDGKLF